MPPGLRMFRERQIPSARSPEQRRFTVGARLWILVMLGLMIVLLYVGQALIGLLVEAVGLVGFLVVFDARRPWWGAELRASSEPVATQANRRTTLALVGMLVGVAIVTTVLVVSFAR